LGVGDSWFTLWGKRSTVNRRTSHLGKGYVSEHLSLWPPNRSLGHGKEEQSDLKEEYGKKFFFLVLCCPG